MSRWSGVLATLLGVVVPTLAIAGQDKFEVGEAVPVFTLKAINNEVTAGEAYISLDRYFGPDAKEPKKATLVTFFATYCEPCKREMPYLGLLFDSYKDRGLQVLSVSIDKEADKVEIAHELAKQNNLKFPVLSDHFNIVAKRYMINKLPCVYLINSEGKVAMVNVGYTEDASKRILDEVRKALGVPASDPVPEAIVAYQNSHAGAGHIESVPVPGATPPPAAPASAPTAGAGPTAAAAPAAAEGDDDGGEDDKGAKKGAKAGAKKGGGKKKGKK
jgi:peroxiredoxin